MLSEKRVDALWRTAIADDGGPVALGLGAIAKAERMARIRFARLVAAAELGLAADATMKRWGYHDGDLRARAQRLRKAANAG